MRVKLTVSETVPAVRLKAETYIEVDTTTPYDGPYEFTPTQNTQTIAIDGLKAISDITINPIPNNWGLITWNGATLTVS